MGCLRLKYNHEKTASNYSLKVIYSKPSNDYYPYGKILRKYVPGNGDERYLTTGHERDHETISENNGGTGLDNRGARFYDSDVARFLSLDPLAADFSNWSAYNYVLGNPISLIDSDGRSPHGPNDPPQRGEGKNAPYIYTIKEERIGETPFMNLGYDIVKYNPDEGKAHLNSLFFNESKIPNRFMAHYKYGGGSQYDLTLDEFKELNISKPSLTKSRQFLRARPGVTTGRFIVPHVYTTQDGTVGEASFIYNGTLVKDGKGNYEFRGTMKLVDRYDFNYEDKERQTSNKFLTWWGHVSMDGDDFRILGPAIQIRETNYRHSYYPNSNSQSGKSEENGGKGF